MVKKKLVELAEWKALKDHVNEIRKYHLKDLFVQDKNRLNHFSLEDDDIYLDYSKNLITTRTMDLLIKLAYSRNLNSEIEKMFAGQKINQTEDRAVLHIAQRNLSRSPIFVNSHNIMPSVFEGLEKMKQTTRLIRGRKWRGYSHKPVKHIVNIGIGGSDLGPRMAFQALEFYSKRDLTFHFVSNIDGTHIKETLPRLNPEKTLFIVASKTFKTEETLTNALTARQWILSHSGTKQSLKTHFFAITGNRRRALNFGIASENIFNVSDWVGGRFSITSAIGLSVMIAIGYRRFIEFLNGFHVMDNHFRYTPLEKNIPVILALLGIWYINFLAASSHAVIPYDHYMREFPVFLQQLDMESNGKSVNRSGHPVEVQTAPIIWGQPGTNGQHAFFQLFHQGTRFIPCDFIGFCESLNEMGDHHVKLMANFFAQTEALAFGKTEEELVREGESEKLIPHKRCQGNRPSNTILAKRLTPFVLGKIIAMYEHKIFSQGIIWDIFSFDQWGVELGKNLAKRITRELDKSHDKPLTHDSSTNHLIQIFKRALNKED